ncbi:MAG TPA: alkaline phosphatase PhoX [Vicinamibacterales bacterium]|nr:alkaline phosphatase PhoX [Vicinamibacterales bacterium]
MRISRRQWLRTAAAVPAWGALRGLESLMLGPLGSIASARSAGYGHLSPARAANTSEILLALPEGFTYTVFGRKGDPMTDGLPTPEAHDGMAAFEVNGELRLVRNHEIRTGPRRGGAIVQQGPSYDPDAGGGTTTLVIDPETMEPTRSFASLSGTMVNCAGGPTPWGSWVTCEETTTGVATGYARPHGYCFEVPADADEPVDPIPLKAMGRFVHEAIAVDPATGIVYLTEDRNSSGLYRFIPARPGQLAEGGRLEMLAVGGHPQYDSRRNQKPFDPMPVAWVPIEDPDPADAETNVESMRQQGFRQGGATFARLEGAWFGSGCLYVTATNGGDRRFGQVWEYRPGEDGGWLRLIYESTDHTRLVGPDNICVSPRGGLVICEDGPEVQYLRGLTVDGQIFDFARNAVPAFEESEFAGATFSPDGRTLFVNIQGPGLTFAIRGDWPRGPF